MNNKPPTRMSHREIKKYENELNQIRLQRYQKELVIYYKQKKYDYLCKMPLESDPQIQSA